VARIYTKTGDDGSTALYYGGRVRKDDPHPRAYGAVDEAQAAIGVARAFSDSPELSDLLVNLERGLYIAMAELATLPENRSKLKAGTTLVDEEMVAALEASIDHHSTLFEAPSGFVLPGGHRVAAFLDVARTTVRRAERDVLAVAVEGSEVVKYLNRLSDLLWVLARWQEGESLSARAQQLKP
jgi:cob(I)alamin adenosyltransferase